MSRTNCAIGKDVAPASFKGVQFMCTEADVEGGRRGAEGEFPFGEQTAYADLGRKIRVYHLTAKFREDNHVGDSFALFRACESPGPGILVHPTRGAVMAACRKCKLKDAIEESAGETEADLEFVEANLGFMGGFGGIIGASLSLFGIVSSGLNSASETHFLARYRPMKVAQPWRTDVINTAQNIVQSTVRVVEQVLDVDSSLSEWRTVVQMWETVHDDGLAAQAKNINEAEVNGFTTISEQVQDQNTKFKIFRGLANSAVTTSKLPPGIGVESEQAVLSRHRILSAIGMAEAAMGSKYPNLNEALTAKDLVLAVFKEEEDAAYYNCDNDLFLEIRKYSVSFTKAMFDLAYRLPGLVRVDFSGGIHPLMAAYAIYNDAKRHRELEEKNIVDANGRFAPLVTGLSE